MEISNKLGEGASKIFILTKWRPWINSILSQREINLGNAFYYWWRLAEAEMEVTCVFYSSATSVF